MKSKFFLIAAFLLAATSLNAQTWDELSDEQKLMKLKSFRADNQKYLKDSLKLTPTRMTDIDNINLCYLSTLDRIDRYGKKQENQEKLAEALTEARELQLNVIMGEEKREKYFNYLKRKIEKAQAKK